MPTPPDRFEHYELLKNPDGSLVELGHGAMGVTYKALDTSLHCPVALKMINAAYLNDPTAEERFLREARGAARLRHRNVASVFHLGRCAEAHYYAMEFIDGQTVDAMVKGNGPFDTVLALEVAAQVASALIAANQQGLVHRDIKPSNLMLTRECDDEVLVKVIDFGLVKSAMISTTGATLTSAGFVGTPYFASPEQLDQRAEDIRSDIYSLGVTLWFMLTGKPTFLGSMASVIMQHLERQPRYEALAVLPGDVVTLLRGMLEKDVEKRIQTPTELRMAIRRCLTGLGAGGPAAVPHPARDDSYQTVALSATRGLRPRPQAGTLLGGRYRLIEDLNPGNPHRTFHAEDTTQKRRVRVKVVEDEEGFSGYLDAELEKLKREPQPSFIEVLAAVRPSGGEAGYVVLEWIDGFSLLHLLRARRELTPREAVALLGQIVPAIDAARRLGIKPELGMRDILVDFPEGFDELSAEVMLRCPLAEWPAFAVKLNPLGRLAEFEAGDSAGAGQTIVPAPRQGTEVSQVGRLAYDLLGGTPASFAPLANLPEQGNEILRRCMNPETTYPSAQAFLDAFAGVAAQAPARVAPAVVEKVAPSPVSKPPEMPIAPASPARRPVKRGPLLIAGAVLTLAVVGVTFRSHPPAPPVFKTPAPPSPIAAPAQRKPPQPGKPWTNSLGAVYLPLEDIHFARTETRVRDFEAFVTATGYDAVGGMYSLQRDGFKQHGQSWKDPGFPQTPEHPVVGVSWDDANQFCAWLTQKERGEGALTAAQFYRLATDREWSLAVGLPPESGATPEERSGRIKGVYPWGRTFPPPPGAGNFAGSETLPEAPERWGAITGYRDGFVHTAPVGAAPGDPLRASDLAGNVWEWCATAYNRTTNWRVLRGGSWATSRAEEILSSFRRGSDPSFRHDDIGFRCVIATDGGER
jgi:serine/threonine protein kinase/formylglycine-generating enzyme required for sulfatase activity